LHGPGLLGLSVHLCPRERGWAPDTWYSFLKPEGPFSAILHEQRSQCACLDLEGQTDRGEVQQAEGEGTLGQGQGGLAMAGSPGAVGMARTGEWAQLRLDPGAWPGPAALSWVDGGLGEVLSTRVAMGWGKSRLLPGLPGLHAFSLAELPVCTASL
jgi:hypothetical protein